MKRKRLVFLYPYYWPLYKAGGPTQSLFNLSNALKAHAEVNLATQVIDVDGSIGENHSQTNKWVVGPNEENIFNAKPLNFFLIWRLLKEKRPDSVFINGIFHFNTTFFGVAICKAHGLKFVISPRGMLQQWALKRKPFKKKIFLSLLRIMLGKNEFWHATDKREAADIQRHFGESQNIFVAPNIPRPLTVPKEIKFNPKSEPIRLVFLSLINPNKNLHLLLKAINTVNRNILLDVYGPIVDQNYWKECLALFSSRVRYKGAVVPWMVPSVLQNYHFFVLPTEGENFGHAIFDALSAGVPVITTRNTPWSKIDESNAGFYLDLKTENSINQILEEITRMSQSEYDKLRFGSFQFAKAYIESRNYLNEYNFLLN